MNRATTSFPTPDSPWQTGLSCLSPRPGSPRLSTSRQAGRLAHWAAGETHVVGQPLDPAARAAARPDPRGP